MRSSLNTTRRGIHWLAGTLAPAIVVLPPIGSHAHSPLMRLLARMAADSGINVAVLTLPYHGKRWPAAQGTKAHAALHFLSGDPDRNAQAFAQSASDVSTVVSWLVAQSGVDTARYRLCRHQPRRHRRPSGDGARQSIERGGRLSWARGDLPDVSRRSLITQVVYLLHPAQKPAHESYRRADRAHPAARGPAHLRGRKPPPERPDGAGARATSLFPPSDATELWNALGRPPIRWLDANHLALRLAPDAPFRAGTRLPESRLVRPQHRRRRESPHTPPIAVPTITLGSRLPIARRQRPGIRPRAHLPARRTRQPCRPPPRRTLRRGNLASRGPFAAAALTVNAFVDVGVASRVGIALGGGRHGLIVGAACCVLSHGPLFLGSLTPRHPLKRVPGVRDPKKRNSKSSSIAHSACSLTISDASSSRTRASAGSASAPPTLPRARRRRCGAGRRGPVRKIGVP